VNAEFFGLAFLAALNPKLLALDLLLIENRRPRVMFACILAGGISMSVAIGLVDVLLVHANAIKSQQKPSAAVDLAIGIVLLAVGGLLVTGRLPPKRRVRRPHASQRPAKKAKDGWAQRALSEPRPLLAFGIGAVCGLPGASYLDALHNLIAGKYSTATQVVAVFVFSVIEFLLIIVPWLLLELWPVGTAAFLRRSQDWIAGHARQFITWTILVVGAYLAISAVVRLT
jgi:hypothetical protein